MPRYKLGPKIGTVNLKRHAAAIVAALLATSAPPAPALIDVELVFVGYVPETGIVTLEVPAFEPATHQPPTTVHLIFLPKGESDPTDLSATVQNPVYPAVAQAVPANPGGEQLSIESPASALDDVDYDAITILEYAV